MRTTEPPAERSGAAFSLKGRCRAATEGWEVVLPQAAATIKGPEAFASGPFIVDYYLRISNHFWEDMLSIQQLCEILLTL